MQKHISDASEAGKIERKAKVDDLLKKYANTRYMIFPIYYSLKPKAAWQWTLLVYSQEDLIWTHYNPLILATGIPNNPEWHIKLVVNLSYTFLFKNEYINIH